MAIEVWREKRKSIDQIQNKEGREEEEIFKRVGKQYEKEEKKEEIRRGEWEE